MLRKIFYHIMVVALLACSLLLGGCIFMKGGYSLSGASIPEAAKTFSVAYFPNNAPMVSPTLSTTLTEALKDKFSRQTKLQQVQRGGDLQLEGEITAYDQLNKSISSDGFSSMVQLKMTVNVRFTNNTNHDEDFERQFSATRDFDATQSLESVQEELVTQMIDEIVNAIFNAAVANW